MLKKIPFHPWLIATYHILLLTAGNLAEIDVWEPAVLIIEIWLGVAVLFSVLCWLLKNKLAAGLASSLVIIFIFAYGPLLNARSSLKAATGFFPSSDLVLLILALLAAAGIAGLLFLYKKKKNDTLSFFNGLANLMAIAMLIVPLANITQEAQTLSSRPNSTSRIETTAQAEAGQPDIFYILLDAYPREDKLAEFYGIDNHPFTTALEQRGFFVGKKSCSNYMRTLLSVSATFNMGYHDDIVKSEGKSLADYRPYVNKIRDNQVAAFLKSRGYTYTHIGSWFAALRANNAADKNISGPARELQLTVWESTSLNKIAQAFFEKQMDYVLQRKHTLFTLAQLQKAAEAPPSAKHSRFVMAHIISPHLPLYFGPNGEDINEMKDSKSYPEKLEGNLHYLNRRILAVIDAVQSTHKNRPAVIIIQGDHGTLPAGKKHPFLGEPEDSPHFIRERSAILNAIYVSPQYQFHPSPAMSSVQTFPVVFNTVFGTQFKIPASRTFYAPPKQPANFKDVTSETDCT